MTLVLWDNTARVFIFTDNLVFLFVVGVIAVYYKHVMMHVSGFQETLDRYSAVEPKLRLQALDLHFHVVMTIWPWGEA
jgi:hypothetical protein